MTRAEMAQLHTDITAAYKGAIKPLYIKYQNQLSNGAVSELFFYWIAKHQHEKIMNIFRKRSFRRRIYKRTRDELEQLKVKTEFSEFESKI